MNNFKLTILIPTYNNGRYVVRALESILSQQSNYPYKVIFLEDCSTDDSVKIIKKYIAKYPKKIFLHQNKINLGLCKNIFNGYQLLETDYFCVLDPDDYWIDNHKVKSALEFLEKNKEYSIYTTNYYLEKDGEREIAIKQKTNCEFSIEHHQKIVLGHTSSTIFRNIVFKNYNKTILKRILNNKNSDVYRGDTFRNYLHLDKGKGFFDKNFTSVYSTNEKGIWNSLNVFEKNLFNAKLYLEMFIFFKSKYQFMLELADYFTLKLKEHATKNGGVLGKKYIKEYIKIIFNKKIIKFKQAVARFLIR